MEIGVLLAIAGTMASKFLVEGWLVPIVVSSGSMATTLLGPHRNVRCPDCGMSFACDAADAAETAAATCPNCGRRGISPDGQIIRGDRLLVDRATFGLRRPRRWEVVLFRCPESAGDYCVKRIVGLPGESVKIRGGDVYVDGAISRKSLSQQREIAVLVHDTAWVGGQHDLPNRWSSQSEGAWQQTGDDWRCSPNGGTHRVADAEIQWLNYIHWRRAMGSSPAVEESPILDEDGYNQAVSRQLNRVTDVMLVCRLMAVGDGMLLVLAHDGRETFQVTIKPATGAIALARSDRVVLSVQATTRMFRQPTEVVISLIDRQIVLAIDGREEIVYQYEPLDVDNVMARSPDRVISPTEGLFGEGGRPSVNSAARSGDRATTVPTEPFSIGASGLDVQVSRLQVYRDVDYTPAMRASDSKSCLLGPDEFYALGDNSPISRDSRPWSGGELVRGSLLIGRPLAIFPRRASDE